MRKLLVIALLAALLIPVFADDGTVLPAGVFRARVIPAFGWMPGSYDKDGKYTTFPNNAYNMPNGAVTTPNLGFSLEYGINDWVTLGFQWAPGLTFSSNIPVPTGWPYYSTANINGLSDLFAGVMVQIVGPKAPVVSDVIRFDLTPGVKIPLSPIDLTTQSGSTQTTRNVDTPAFGIGGRAYLDYIFSPSFFIDLYTQFIDYPSTVDGKYYSSSDAGTAVGYGYDLRIELDPHYTMPLSDALTLSANCAFRYDSAPDVTLGGTAQSDTHWILFSANPSVSVFFTKMVVPFELQLDYGQPLYGINAAAAYSLDLQAKVYFKL